MKLVEIRAFRGGINAAADEDAAGEYVLQQRRSLHAIVKRDQAEKYLNT